MESQESDLASAEYFASPGACPVVVVAASAGGMKALGELLSAIAPGFGAAIAVVQHRSAQHPNLLVQLLSRKTSLHVQEAQDGTSLQPSTVYVCPAGMHMTAGRALQIFEAPKLNYVRPSADLMFVSLARAYGRAAIGVVLSERAPMARLAARPSWTPAEPSSRSLLTRRIIPRCQPRLRHSARRI